MSRRVFGEDNEGSYIPPARQPNLSNAFVVCCQATRGKAFCETTVLVWFPVCDVQIRPKHYSILISTLENPFAWHCFLWSLFNPVHRSVRLHLPTISKIAELGRTMSHHNKAYCPDTSIYPCLHINTLREKQASRGQTGHQGSGASKGRVMFEHN